MFIPYFVIYCHRKCLLYTFQAYEYMYYIQEIRYFAKIFVGYY